MGGGVVYFLQTTMLCQQRDDILRIVFYPLVMFSKIYNILVNGYSLTDLGIPELIILSFTSGPNECVCVFFA